MDCSTPGFPVHHQHLGLALTHVYRVSNAIQPSHPLSSSSPSAFNLSQHQSFSVSQLFASGGQSIGVSALASVLPINIQDWFPLDWLVWSPWSPRDSQQSSPTTQFQKHQFFTSAFFMVQLSHPSMTTGKTIALTTQSQQTFVNKLMSLYFNMLSWLVIDFLPRSKHLTFMAAVTIGSGFGAQKNKVSHYSPCFSIYRIQKGKWRAGNFL